MRVRVRFTVMAGAKARASFSVKRGLGRRVVVGLGSALGLMLGLLLVLGLVSG